MKFQQFCHVSMSVMFIAALGVFISRQANTQSLPTVTVQQFQETDNINKGNNTGQTGIKGQVTLDPINPVEQLGVVNARPYQATITVLNLIRLVLLRASKL